MTATSPSSLHAEAVAMGGIAAPPTRDGEPCFAEPWQGRAFALAVETVARLGMPWDTFRQRLVAAIAAYPHRPYYDSWLEALEALVLDHRLAGQAELDAHRMAAAAYRVDEPGSGDTEIFPIAVGEPVLRRILDALFGRWWPHIRFGTVIQGAVYAGTAGYPGAAELVRLRRCAHAELARILVDGVPTSWMFRMYDGAGEQQLTVLLPNPFLDDDQQPLAASDWSRLACWDELRRDVLDLPPDPLDRVGATFVHP